MKSLKEFEKWYNQVNCKDDDIAQLNFVWEIMKSPYTEFYYSLIINKNTNNKFRSNLWSRFDEPREKAVELLLSKLDRNEDTEFHPDIIFHLGIIADRQKAEKERIVEYARKFADAADDFLRDRAIIVLGWIGGIKDIPLIGNHLLHDTNAKCRAWSATSFMQMYFRRKSKSLVEKALTYLEQAILQETDYFALGCMIDVVKELSGKKFDLPQYAIDNVDKERIDAAKIKVERFFAKRK